MAIPEPRRQPVRATAAAVAVVAVCVALLVASGRTIGYVAGTAALIGPLLVAIAVWRPYVFPYALYALLVPFDNLLAVGHGGTITRYLGLGAGAFLLLYILRTRELVRPPVAAAAWLGYAAWAGASIAWSVSPDDATKGALQLLQLVALYAIVAAAPVGRRDMRTIIAAIVVGGALAGLYGAYQFSHSSLAVLAQEQKYSRLIVQVGEATIDANHFGNALIAPLLLAIVGALGARSWVWRTAWLVAAVPALAGLLLSASRGATLGLVAGIITIAVLGARYRKRIVLFGLFALGLSFAFPNLWVRFGTALTNGGSGRTSIWRVGLAAVKDHWLIGTGIENFKYAYDDSYLTVFQPYVAGWSRVAHDVFLQIAVELGIVGVTLFVIAAVASVRSGAASLRQTFDDPELDDWRIATVASLVGLAVAAVFIDLVTYKYVWLALCTAAQVRGIARAHARLRLRAEIYSVR